MAPSYYSQLETIDAFRLGQRQGVKTGLVLGFVALVAYKAARTVVYDRLELKRDVTYEVKK